MTDNTVGQTTVAGSASGDLSQGIAKWAKTAATPEGISAARNLIRETTTEVRRATNVDPELLRKQVTV